jgi:hypothetical protein
MLLPLFSSPFQSMPVVNTRWILQITLALLFQLVLFGCARQFTVTVNSQTVYDPRLQTASAQLTDANLQGCVNFALQQQQLQNPIELSTVSCAASAVRELEGIEALVALRFLDLANNGITDLRPLVGLVQLSGLNIPNNPLRDISPLFSMPHLAVVNLQGNGNLPCTQLAALEQQLGAGLTRPENCRNN